MFISFASKSQKLPSNDGQGTIAYEMMKGQAVILAETNKNGNFTVEVEFSQDMAGMVTDINQSGQFTLSIPVSKNKPGVGSLTM